MKRKIIINEQKLKFYSINQLRYSYGMRSNFREEISDKETLVNYILEQLKCNKVDEVRWSCFLQELITCIEIEQVPETWEELKELCKGLKGIEFFYDKVACVEYININDVIAFNENGLMLTAKHNYDILAKKRTPQQMWQIIKNLIGAEQ